MIDRVATNPADFRNTASKKAQETGVKPEPGGRGEAVGQAGRDGSGDRVTLGSKAAEGVYRKPAGIDNSLDARLMVMRDLVAKIFEKQGLSTSIDLGGGKVAALRDITPQQAADLVSDDGYWGVDKTSQRIADFAINAAGNDPAKLDAVKEGVLKGFAMAEKGFGAALPEISRKTLDAVMARLDDWAKAQEAPAAPPAEPTPAA